MYGKFARSKSADRKAKPQVAFTLDVYSHIIEGMQEEAMNLLDEVLPAGVSKTNSTNLV